MSGLFGKIFGSSDATKELIEATKNGLDALIHTDEEKSEAAAKDRSEARSMVVEWLKNTQGQNLSRRLIALSIGFVWLLHFQIGLIVDLSTLVWPEHVKALTTASNMISARLDTMTGAMMLILGFYFAAPHMTQIANVAMQRFSNGGK